MVRIHRVTTRRGDEGGTVLGDGRTVAKTDARIEACGSVDEANASIGLALAAASDSDWATLAAIREVLQAVQNDLFDLGADLAVPMPDGEAMGQRLRITPQHVGRLETAIAKWNDDLPPLRSFVLPGGSPFAAHLHLARTIVRRAERRVAALWLSAPQATNQLTLVYLNRLSDLLFVLARVAQQANGDEITWQPGASAGQ